MVLHGGINAVLWDKVDEVTEAIIQNVPVLKENGGYIFSSDHSIPNTVSLENFTNIIKPLKRRENIKDILLCSISKIID